MAKITPQSTDQQRKERHALFIEAGELLLSFSHLERALSHLFGEAIIAPPITSNAVYYGIKSIDSRLEIISNVLEVRCGENTIYNQTVLKIWTKIKDQIRARKDIRNVVSHGQVTSGMLRTGKSKSLYLPIPEDQSSMRRFIKYYIKTENAKPQFFGIDINEIKVCTKKIHTLQKTIKKFAEIIFLLGYPNRDENCKALPKLVLLSQELQIPTDDLNSASPEGIQLQLQPHPDSMPGPHS